MERLAALGVVLSGLGYVLALVRCRRRGRAWPTRRALWWCLGTVACAAAAAGPLAERADVSFAAHMGVHLLVGMAGPLLLVRAAPLSLALRVLPVGWARLLTRGLASRPVRFAGHPVIAGGGNVAALILLCTTGLYDLTGRHQSLHLLVHVHFFAFGYLFAAGIVGVDPDRHRLGFGYRSGVLVLFSAAHSMLAKHVYAVPPRGVDPAQAQLGAQILYYGSDAVDLAMMVLLWHRWYVGAGRHADRGSPVGSPRLRGFQGGRPPEVISVKR